MYAPTTIVLETIKLYVGSTRSPKKMFSRVVRRVIGRIYFHDNHLRRSQGVLYTIILADEPNLCHAISYSNSQVVLYSLD